MKSKYCVTINLQKREDNKQAIYKSNVLANNTSDAFAVAFDRFVNSTNDFMTYFIKSYDVVKVIPTYLN